MPHSDQDTRAVEPPQRLLLCLGSCHGEFYLPLAAGEAALCPNDRYHPVAVYEGPVVFKMLFPGGSPESDEEHQR